MNLMDFVQTCVSIINIMFKGITETFAHRNGWERLFNFMFSINGLVIVLGLLLFWFID